MFCRTISALAIKAVTCTSKHATVEYDDGRKVQLIKEWVLDNDVNRRHWTGQKTSCIYDDPQYRHGNIPNILSCGVREDRLIFQFENGKESHVLMKHIEKYGLRPQLQRCPSLRSAAEIHRVPFSSFSTGENRKESSDEFFQALKRLALDGIIVVEGCPVDSDVAVTKVARSIDVEMPTLYGTTFLVKTKPDSGPKNNVAYTGEYLDLHQDLAYYESQPGLQLLLCQRYDDSVKGGDSFFVDAFPVAYRLQDEHPQAFDVLKTYPVAFMKDDTDRPNPAQYFYTTPHIHVNHQNVVTKVFWAPAFEAPMPLLPPEEMKKYYEARRIFQDLLEQARKNAILKFKVRPGECIVWNQPRVLHAREAFTEVEPGTRVLNGCYVNIDAFRNRIFAEAERRGDAETLKSLNIPFANRSYH